MADIERELARQIAHGPNPTPKSPAKAQTSIYEEATHLPDAQQTNYLLRKLIDELRAHEAKLEETLLPVRICAYAYIVLFCLGLVIGLINLLD